MGKSSTNRLRETSKEPLPAEGIWPQVLHECILTSTVGTFLSNLWVLLAPTALNQPYRHPSTVSRLVLVYSTSSSCGVLTALLLGILLQGRVVKSGKKENQLDSWPRLPGTVPSDLILSKCIIPV